MEIYFDESNSMIEEGICIYFTVYVACIFSFRLVMYVSWGAESDIYINNLYGVRRQAVVV